MSRTCDLGHSQLTTNASYSKIRDMPQASCCAEVVRASLEAGHRTRLCVLGLQSCYHVGFCT